MLNVEKKGWYYFAVKEPSALLRGVITKHDGGFYYLNCLHYIFFL